MEAVTCDLCGNDEARLVYRVRDTNYGTPGLFQIVQCCKCQLAYLNPRPAEYERPATYPEDWYDPFSSIRNPSQTTPHPLQRQRGRWLTKAIGLGRILDVGCADGLFLKAMQELGWKCVGLEPNQRVAEFARIYLRLDVRQGDIFTSNEFGSFDLITLWDVLEHTPSPKAVLSHASKLLASRGIIALSLPNWSSLERLLFRERWIAIDAPRHFYHFTPETISHLLRECGFKIKILQTRAPVLSLASNLLRLGGDLVLRKGKTKVVQGTRASIRIPPSQQRQTVIRLTHFGMMPFNTIINLFGRGASLTIVASKVT